MTSWKGKVRGVLVAARSARMTTLSTASIASAIRFACQVVARRTPATTRPATSGSRNTCGIIDAAVYQLRLQRDDDEPVDIRSFDPSFGSKAKKLAEDADWGKVASQTAIFVEDRIRTRAYAAWR